MVNIRMMGNGKMETLMGVSKNKGKTTKMDGENNGNPIKMDDLGVTLFLETPL